MIEKGLPSLYGVKNPPSNAGNTGLIPCWGTKIPDTMGQLSLCATTREDQAPQPEKPTCSN